MIKEVVVGCGGEEVTGINSIAHCRTDNYAVKANGRTDGRVTEERI